MAKQIHRKTNRKTHRQYTLKKAITHLQLRFANAGKLQKVDELAEAYLALTQSYCDWLIGKGESTPDRNADIPATIQTLLSERWKRCAWRQACGIVQSWFSNGRTHPPILHTVAIQADANVAALQKARKGMNDYWVRFSTLEKRKPVYLPVRLYRRAAQTLEKYPHLCSGVRLDRVEGKWFLTLVVGKENRKPQAEGVVGVDIGLKAMVVTSRGDHFGEISQPVRDRVEKANAKRARKQRLNVCLKKKGLPAVDLQDQRTERMVRNAAGRAINQMLASLPVGVALALERLNVQDMRFKSRQMNRWLHTGQLGFLSTRLKVKCDLAGIRYRSVQAAYSSQECSHCGYVDPRNRRDQAHFQCGFCGFSANADYNAALVIAKRFGDDELNRCSYKNVKALLQARFEQSLLVARSATTGRDTQGDSPGPSVQLILV